MSNITMNPPSVTNAPVKPDARCTIIQNHFGYEPKPKDLSDVRGLANFLRSDEVKSQPVKPPIDDDALKAAKAQLKMIKLATFVNDQCNRITDYQGTGLTLSPSLDTVYGYELDLDGKNFTADTWADYKEAIKICASAGIEAVAHPSFQSTEAKPRWRLFVLLAEPYTLEPLAAGEKRQVDPKRHKALCALDQLFVDHKCPVDTEEGLFFGSESWDTQRKYYIGRNPEDGFTPYGVAGCTGVRIDQWSKLDEYAKRGEVRKGAPKPNKTTSGTSAATSSGQGSGEAIQDLPLVADDQQVNITTAFNRVADMRQVLQMLGYKKVHGGDETAVGDVFRKPNRTTDAGASVYIKTRDDYPDQLAVYSYHVNDPMNKFSSGDKTSWYLVQDVIFGGEFKACAEAIKRCVMVGDQTLQEYNRSIHFNSGTPIPDVETKLSLDKDLLADVLNPVEAAKREAEMKKVRDYIATLGFEPPKSEFADEAMYKPTSPKKEEATQKTVEPVVPPTVPTPTPVVEPMAGKGTSAAPVVPSFDNMQPEKFDLMQHLPESMFKRHVRSVAEAAWMPQSTVMLVGLGVVSGVNSRAYSVAYPNGEPLPLSLYIVAGQPPATAKTRVLKSFQHPVFAAEKIVKQKRMEAAEAEATESGKKAKPEYLPSVFRTDATPEAIDKNLLETNGFFNLVSSEQAILNTVLGSTYGGDRKSNNDLLLKGFNAEFHSSQRAGRNGFTGTVVSSVVCFSQSGAIRTIYAQTDGGSTGLAERFLCIEEPHNLGKRDHRKVFKEDYEAKTAYDAVVGATAERVLSNPQPEFEDLPKLLIHSEGWRLITDYRQALEHQLGDGGAFSNSTLRGIGGKVDMPIMKIAANLHLLDGNPNFVIGKDCVISAINIVDDLLKRTTGLLQTLGVSGTSAEDETVMDYVLKNGKKTRKQIVNSVRQAKVFAEAEGSSAIAAGKTVDRLLDSGELRRDQTGVITAIAD